MAMSLRRTIRALLNPCGLGALTLASFSAPLLAQQPAAEPGTALEEVVVTAQFRSQPLQDTPIAITAISADMIESRSQNDLASLADQAPNVILRETGGAFGPGMSANIRGVGQADFNPALEPGVGVYIDDVYYASLTGANFDLVDVDRVEILRGPQGTLAGRNSIGGAIKLFSALPKGDDSGSLKVTYGTRHLFDVRASADLALVPDRVFLRAAGVSRSQDGYVNRYDFGCTHPGSGVPNNGQQADCFLGTEGGKKYSGGRIGLRFVASDSLDINLSADAVQDNSEVAAVVLQGVNPAASGALASTQYGVPYDERFLPPNEFTSYAAFGGRTGSTLYSWEPKTTTFNWGTAATIDWKISDTLSLKSITAYRAFDSRWVEDNDVSPLAGSLGAEHLYHDQFSQELRLNGALLNSKVEYTLGGYYFDQTTTYQTHQVLTYAGDLDFLGDDPVEASTYAAFLNATTHVTDALNVNTGVRYSKESKDYHYSRNNPDGTPHGFLGALNGVVGSFEGHKIDYRVNADYRWNENLMTYAGVSTGFKGGGSNPRPFFATQVQPFNQETITAYEVGAKSDLLERRLRVNLSVFLNKYKEIQLTRLTCPEFSPPGLGFLCALPTNGGDADVKGVELEFEAHPFGGLQIDGSYSKLDFEYTRTRPDVGIEPGDTAPGTIENKWSFGIQYAMGGGSTGTFTPRFDVHYQSGYHTNVAATPDNLVPGYHLGNVRLTWDSPEQKWQGAFAVTNVFDKTYYLSVFDLLASSGAKYGTPDNPREYSLTIKRKF
jgi:iron complex outermembrane recepter protein